MSLGSLVNKSIRILHIDDDASVNFFVTDFFRVYYPEIDIIYLSNPEKALEYLLSEEIDCIISDYNMPVMTGIELARIVKEEMDIPFILYTGHGSEEVASEAYLAGIDDYIRKETETSHYEILINRVLSAVEKHQTQKLFKDIAEKSFDAIFTLNPKGIFTYASPALTKICGYSIEELVGSSFRKIVCESDIPKLLKVINESSDNLLNIEIRMKNMNIIEVNLSRVFKNNSLESFLGIARDITERKKFERELEESREHFRILFNSMIDPVVIVDKKGVILELSEGVEQVTGFTREELLYHNFMDVDIVTRKSKRLLLKHLAVQLLGKKTKPYSIEVLTKDGRVLSYEINADRIQYQGKTVLMATFRARNNNNIIQENDLINTTRGSVYV